MMNTWHIKSSFADTFLKPCQLIMTATASEKLIDTGDVSKDLKTLPVNGKSESVHNLNASIHDFKRNNVYAAATRRSQI